MSRDSNHSDTNDQLVQGNIELANVPVHVTRLQTAFELVGMIEVIILKEYPPTIEEVLTQDPIAIRSISNRTELRIISEFDHQKSEME